MLMHISPVLSMWIFFRLKIRHASTAFSPFFLENVTKYKALQIYRQFHQKIAFHIIHIIHIFVWIVKEQNTLFSFEKSCAIMQVTYEIQKAGDRS